MSIKDRKRVQEGWMNDDYRCVVTTVAFGLGINKPRVRYVIHSWMPFKFRSILSTSNIFLFISSSL